MAFDGTCDDCTLHVGWYFDLLVADPWGDPVPGASVVLVDLAGDSVLQETTGLGGRIPRGEVVGYTWTRSKITDRNDHTLHITRSSYLPVEMVLAMRGNIDMVVSMVPDTVSNPTLVEVGGSAGGAGLSATPNPAAGAVVLRYRSPAPSPLRLAVYDVRGRQVASLLDGERLLREGEIVWDGRDGRGSLLPAGVYFARLVTAEGARVAKIVLSRD